MIQLPRFHGHWYLRYTSVTTCQRWFLCSAGKQLPVEDLLVSTQQCVVLESICPCSLLLLLHCCEPEAVGNEVRRRGCGGNQQQFMKASHHMCRRSYHFFNEWFNFRAVSIWHTKWWFCLKHFLETLWYSQVCSSWCTMRVPVVIFRFIVVFRIRIYKVLKVHTQIFHVL